MVQDQLVDYISSQIKLGVSRDAIKSALVSAGWVAADVEDTLKKVMGAGVASPNVIAVAAKPAQPQTPTSMAANASPVNAKPVGVGGESQTIRVSDLISGSPASSKPVTPVSASSPKITSGISGNTFQAPPMDGKMSGGGGHKKAFIGSIIIAAILVVACAGAAWYFYSMNAGLAAKVSSLTTESASVSSQLSTLQSQVNASSTGFAAQLASLTAANSDLALDLSFYAVPIGGASSSAGVASPITVSGSLSGGGKAPYALTTPRGAKIFIANSADATISSQLKPLVGQTILLNGTYVPGSDSMTVTSISSSTSAMSAS